MQPGLRTATLREGPLQRHLLPRGSTVLCSHLLFPGVFLSSCFQGHVAPPLETIPSPLRAHCSKHQHLLMSSLQLSMVPMGWLFGSCGGRVTWDLRTIEPLRVSFPQKTPILGDQRCLLSKLQGNPDTRCWEPCCETTWCSFMYL